MSTRRTFSVSLGLKDVEALWRNRVAKAANVTGLGMINKVMFLQKSGIECKFMDTLIR